MLERQCYCREVLRCGPPGHWLEVCGADQESIGFRLALPDPVSTPRLLQLAVPTGRGDMFTCSHLPHHFSGIAGIVYWDETRDTYVAVDRASDPGTPGRDTRPRSRLPSRAPRARRLPRLGPRRCPLAPRTSGPRLASTPALEPPRASACSLLALVPLLSARASARALARPAPRAYARAQRRTVPRPRAQRRAVPRPRARRGSAATCRRSLEAIEE
uniref:Uncharacterized protein n=1 Tax=Ananas comosus var. bracteatus TaxID=296719 RepID=A0A6V7QBC1_ANACO|nr:unnamed protein product [Ananas comosus var. bracteatus]